MTTAVSTASITPRRRWLRRFAVAAVALAALWAAFSWLDRWQQERAWQEACAEADRLDPGWRWDDLIAARPNPRDEQNAVLRVRAVKGLLPANWYNSALHDRLSNPAPNQRPPSADAAALQRDLSLVAGALSRTVGLEDLTNGRLPGEPDMPHPVRDMLPVIQEMREVAVLLKLHALLLADEGQVDEALTVVRRLIVDARAADSEPLLINGLVCAAFRAVVAGSLMRVLAQGEPTPDALAAMQRALEAEIERPLFADILRGERAALEAFMRAVDDGRMTLPQAEVLSGASPPPVTGVALLDRWINQLRGSGWHRGQAAEEIRCYTAVIELAKKSPAALTADDIDEAIASAGVGTVTRKTHTALVLKVRDADARTQALLRSAAVAVAAERFRRDRARWPLTIGEMVPEYVKAVPLDPYDGQLLRFVRLADGVVVYSVGPDKVDDGGNVVTSPFGMPSKDVGFRLWDVAKRRQPP